MGLEEQLDAQAAGPGPVPEQWETAIEDAAQLVALGLDRAQDVADLINDFARAHPNVAKAVLAGAAGVLVGSFIAERTLGGRKRTKADSSPAPVRNALRRASVVEEAAGVARDAAARIARRAPARAELRAIAAPGNGVARAPRRSLIPNPRDVRYAAELLPIVLALVKNPLVRQFLWRSAVRVATKR
jgi:hypothetical protein